MLARAARHDPRLIGDYARWFIDGKRAAAAAQRRTLANALGREDLDEYIARTLGPWSEGPGLALVEDGRVVGAGGGEGVELALRMAGDPNLGRIAYAAVRAFRPAVVIETGVAVGVTSAYVLAALHDNGMGNLHSIDLPPTDLVIGGLVGGAIPERLRTRWSYHWGTSRRLLPRLLEHTAGRRRVFIHDADHTYDAMRWELEVACGSLGAGDVVIADDVDLHDAFREVATAVGAHAAFIAKSDGSTAGIMTRPDARAVAA